jgi:ribosomal protein L37AE/L43A
MTTHHLCPCCQSPLHVEREEDMVIVWCGNDRCHSEFAEAGGYGLVELEAVAMLLSNVEYFEGLVAGTNRLR